LAQVSGVKGEKFMRKTKGYTKAPSGIAEELEKIDCYR
jgi:hypothetical protein